MTQIEFARLYPLIQNWARRQSIDAEDHILPAGKAGEFNGLTVSMNSTYSLEERSYYLIHALGSIIGWSLNKTAVQEIFTELREAKKGKDIDSARLESAIIKYQAFENESSRFAVSIFHRLDFPDVIDKYSNFMRADLEALTQFHRHGRAPVWKEFFARWNDEVARGIRKVTPFDSQTIPQFYRTQIEMQEILQEQ